MFLLLLLQTIWLGLPAAISNMTPPIATRFFSDFLNIPIDAHKSFRRQRILGNNKTVRGLLLGILTGELAFLLQQSLISLSFFRDISILPYTHLPWFFGFLFGIGALGGDMVKSFAKRQVGIPAGKTWILFDQMDWIIGLLVVLKIFVPIPWHVILVGLCLGIILHVVVKFVGFSLGLDKEPI